MLLVADIYDLSMFLFSLIPLHLHSLISNHSGRSSLFNFVIFKELKGNSFLLAAWNRPTASGQSLQLMFTVQKTLLQSHSFMVQCFQIAVSHSLNHASLNLSPSPSLSPSFFLSVFLCHSHNSKTTTWLDPRLAKKAKPPEKGDDGGERMAAHQPVVGG